MAEAIAIVSIVSGAAVAIVVPFINSRLERSRMQSQSRDARMEELRGLLDGSIQHLYAAWTSLFEIDEQRQQELPRPDLQNEFLLHVGGTLAEQADAIVQDGLRIRLRTPPESAIGSAHLAAQNVFLAYEAQYRSFLRSELMEQEKPPRSSAQNLSSAIGVFMNEIQEFVGVVEATDAAESRPPDHPARPT
jgi:hypothetical protein